MPGKWVSRDPENGEVLRELSQDAMSQHLRRSNPDSPEYVKETPHGAARVTQLDEKTVSLAVVGMPGESLFRWEWDLYEGWAEARHPSPRMVLVTAANYLGMSLVDFLAASGATTDHARRMVKEERKLALSVAEPLLTALLALIRIRTASHSTFTRDWFEDRYLPLVATFVEVLTRLTGGNAERAHELAGVLLDPDDVCPVEYMLSHWEKAWHAEDHPSRQTIRERG